MPIQTSAGICSQSGSKLSCGVSELAAGAVVTVRLSFDPTDNPDRYLETVGYDAVIGMTAKAATKAGAKSNFGATCACSDSVTFLLAAQDDDNTTTYGATGENQQAQVTPPPLPDTKLFVFTTLLSRQLGEFCGVPATLLGTCFGDSVHVEVEDASGVAYVFDGCNLAADLREATCLRIDIAWDPDGSGMPLLYQLTPSLMTVYHDGEDVPRRDALVSPEPDGDPGSARACSETPEVLGAGDARGPHGWIAVRIYSDRNGNWGAG